MTKYSDVKREAEDHIARIEGRQRNEQQAGAWSTGPVFDLRADPDVSARNDKWRREPDISRQQPQPLTDHEKRRLDFLEGEIARINQRITNEMDTERKFIMDVLAEMLAKINKAIAKSETNFFRRLRAQRLRAEGKDAEIIDWPPLPRRRMQ